MISRSTLIGALVVVELALVGASGQAIVGSQPIGFGSVTKPPSLDRTLLTGPSPHVVLDVHDIDVVIDARASQPGVHAAETLTVTGFASGAIPPMFAVSTPDGVRITAGDGDVRFMMGCLKRSVRVTVPADARVEILTAGRIDAAGLRTKLVAHSPDGSVHVRDHRGDLDVSTSSGRIELVDVQGSDIAANTHEGRLYFTRVGAERIDAHSNYGRIYAVDLRVKNGALNTHSGRISASFTGDSDATVNVSAGDAKVTVAGLPATQTADDKSTVRLGAGNGHFEVSTDDGAVNISQGASV